MIFSVWVFFKGTVIAQNNREGEGPSLSFSTTFTNSPAFEHLTLLCIWDLILGFVNPSQFNYQIDTLKTSSLTLSNWLPRYIATFGLLYLREHEFKVSFQESLKAICKCSICNETSSHRLFSSTNTMKFDRSKQN